MELHYLELAELSRKIRHQEVSAVEVTEAMLSRIEAHDPALCSYITLTAQRARDAARRADTEIARGFWRGPLHGVPIAVKDVLDTSFAPTTVGMAVRAHHMAKSNATAIDRLENAGAVFLGKLVTAEGIFIDHHETLRTPVNPRDAAYWTGVSSSGSGIATAAGLCFGSLGTDTGGSIRVPASVNGLTGLKPGWGRVSRAGLFPLAPTLDHLGPMTRSAQDAAIMLAAIAGHDPADPTSLMAPVPDYCAHLTRPISGLRIGVDERHVSENVDPQVSAAFSAALDVLVQLGARIVAVTVPSIDDILAGWSLLCSAEAALAHRGLYPERAAEYGADLTELIELGRNVTAAELTEAHLDRQVFIGRMQQLFADIDILATPTLPATVPLTADVGAIIADSLAGLGRYTVPPNVTGQPAISLPCGMDNAGHPIGLQLVSRHLEEPLLLNVAHLFQMRTDWHTQHPVLS